MSLFSHEHSWLHKFDNSCDGLHHKFSCSTVSLSFFKLKIKQKLPSDLPLTNIGDTNSPGTFFDFLMTFLFSKEWSSYSKKFDLVSLKHYLWEINGVVVMGIPETVSKNLLSEVNSSCSV